MAAHVDKLTLVDRMNLKLEEVEMLQEGKVYTYIAAHFFLTIVFLFHPKMFSS